MNSQNSSSAPGRQRAGASRQPGPRIRERISEALWRLGLQLRRRVPVFQEERLLGRTLILLRALAQLPSCVLKRPGQRSLDMAWLCLRLARRYTMISPALLFRMYDIAQEADESGVEGAVVECGVWNGGSAALLAVAAMGRRGDRDIWLFDSFEGLPPPTERDPEAVRAGYFPGWNTGSESRVREIWRELRLPPGRLRILRGWFSETFPRAGVRSIAVLHIDCDWYESVKLCLERFYDSVRPGGVIFMNDYNVYSGANEAVHEFLAERGAPVQVRLLGKAGAWFSKPARRVRAAPGPWPSPSHQLPPRPRRDASVPPERVAASGA